MNTYSALIRLYSTEKSTLQNEQGKYTFLVNRDATKVDIKLALKTIYGVEAESVNIIRVPKKTRIIRGRKEMTKRPEFKKAIVKLKGDNAIDFNKLKEKK